jgi:hypothetical protein
MAGESHSDNEQLLRFVTFVKKFLGDSLMTQLTPNDGL